MPVDTGVHMQTFDTRFVAAAAAALLLASSGAVAGSLAASSAAGGSSASSASSAGSDSSGKSSDSSSQTKTAAGPYRIVAVAVLPDQPGKVRLQLQSLSDAGDAGAYVLYLPQQIVKERGLLVGGTVLATSRPYGTEFAAADTHEAFFLLMHDDWYNELAARPLVL